MEGEEKIKYYLRNGIMNAIVKKNEFGFLEKLCCNNEVEFTEKIADYCLDRYIALRKEGEDQFKAKYAAMFRTAWMILFG